MDFSSGVASLNYQRDSAEGFTERITGSYERLRDTTRRYSVHEGVGRRRRHGGVVTSDEMSFLGEYDSNDAFNIGRRIVPYSDFEDDLTIGDTLSYEITNTRSSTITSLTLTNR